MKYKYEPYKGYLFHVKRNGKEIDYDAMANDLRESGAKESLIDGFMAMEIVNPRGSALFLSEEGMLHSVYCTTWPSGKEEKFL